MFIRFTEYMNMKSDNVMSVFTRTKKKRSHAPPMNALWSEQDQARHKKREEKLEREKKSRKIRTTHRTNHLKRCRISNYARGNMCAAPSVASVFRFTLWLTLSILIKQTKKNNFFSRVLCSHCITRGLKFIHISLHCFEILHSRCSFCLISRLFFYIP